MKNHCCWEINRRGPRSLEGRPFPTFDFQEKFENLSTLNSWPRQRKLLPEQCQNLPWLPDSGPLGLCLESQDLDIDKELASFLWLFAQHFSSPWAFCPQVCQGGIRSLKQGELLAETTQWVVTLWCESWRGVPGQSGPGVALILVSAANLLLWKEW